MDVAIIADKLNISKGGSNYSLDLIAESLATRGNDVTVVTVHFAHENELPEERSYEVRSQPLDGDSRLANARIASRRLEELAPEFDLMHVFNPALLPSAGWYKRGETTTPIVGRLNTYDVFCTNLAHMDGECHRNCTVYRKFTHSTRELPSNTANIPKYVFDTYAFPRLANELDRLFAISPQVADVFKGIGLDRSRISVVPNFYDPAFNGGTEDVQSFEYEKTALYAGALKKYKGPHLLIDALTELPEQYGVAIAGEGPARTALEKRASQCGVRERVTFLGWVDHEKLPPYYKGADAFVHPGLWPEPFGRTILEAMQCRCPPVVSDVGAPPWIVEDCGLVFERDDSTHLASQIAMLFDDDRTYAELQTACDDRLAEFAPERTVSRIEQQYRDLVS